MSRKEEIPHRLVRLEGVKGERRILPELNLFREGKGDP